MQSLFELLGLPVLCTETGKQVGEVEEALLSVRDAALDSLVVSGTAWLAEKKRLPFAELHRIGADAVTVQSEAKLLPFAQEYVLRQRLYGAKQLQGKRLDSEAGARLGVLADIVFDSRTGEIRSYLVSDGWVSDLLHGRAEMPLPQAQVVCEERIIVPESMEKLLHFT